MTEDLTARLLAAIAEREQGARADLADESALHARRRRANEDLRRCAADRKILAEILPEIAHNDRLVESEYGTDETSAEDLLRALAAAYGITTEETT